MNRQFYVNFEEEINGSCHGKTKVVSATSFAEAVKIFYSSVPRSAFIAITSVVDTKDGSQKYDNIY